MKKTTYLRVLAATLALSLFLGMMGAFSTVGVVAAPTLGDLEAELKDLKEKEQTIKNELAAASTDLTNSKKRKELLEQQITNAEQQIALLGQRIREKEAEISTTEAAIAEKNAGIVAAEQAIAAMEGDIESTHVQLGDRLHAIAKTGNLSALQRLLNTENYEDFLLKSKAAECIAERDQEIMDLLKAALGDIHTAKESMEQQKKEIEAEKTALEAQKSQLQTLKKDSDDKKKELDVLCAAVQSEIQNLQSSVTDYNNELKDVQKKMEEADAAIEEMIKKLMEEEKKKQEAEKLHYDDNLMWWPVPAVCNISSHFGPRWGTMHRGIDISEGPVPVYGQDIYAAADGEVIAVNYTSSYGIGWSYGYGYCVIVYHGEDSQGRAITTMYAHASKMYARVGDKVKGGETILAQVGKTGNVTGPHLHFEVRVDGVRVNPYPNYIRPDTNIPTKKN